MKITNHFHLFVLKNNTIDYLQKHKHFFQGCLLYRQSVFPFPFKTASPHFNPSVAADIIPPA